MSQPYLIHLFNQCRNQIICGDLFAANRSLHEIFKIVPKNPEAFRLLSIIQTKQNKLKNALESINKGLNTLPNNGSMLNTKGIIMKKMGRLNEALILFEHANQLDPNNPEILVNIGNTLQDINKLNDAIVFYDYAISLAPTYSEAYSNKANVIKTLGDLKEAEVLYLQSLKINPDDATTKWNLALLKLLLGDFQSGLNYYESRWFREDSEAYRYPHIPPLVDINQAYKKKILVWYEQGLGDTIQFCRYLNELSKFGAELFFECQTSLKKLISNNFKVTVIDQNTSATEFDFQIPLLSLPFLFKTRLGTIPSYTPYIQIADANRYQWSEKIKCSNKKMKVGIACSGNLVYDIKYGNTRPVPLDYFQSLLPFTNLYLIQKDIRGSDSETLKNTTDIVFLGPLINDFIDSASIIANMDLIISVDTSLIHLSGAMNIPTFALLPYIPDWRWLLDRDSSPWYPSMKLFRQQSAGDWEGVMERIVNEVQLIAKNK